MTDDIRKGDETASFAAMGQQVGQRCTDTGLVGKDEPAGRLARAPIG